MWSAIGSSNNSALFILTNNLLLTLSLLALAFLRMTHLHLNFLYMCSAT